MVVQQFTEESLSNLTTSSPPTNTVADFLRLKISANTRKNYSKAIADFCRRTYEREVSEV